MFAASWHIPWIDCSPKRSVSLASDFLGKLRWHKLLHRTYGLCVIQCFCLLVFHVNWSSYLYYLSIFCILYQIFSMVRTGYFTKPALKVNRWIKIFIVYPIFAALIAATPSRLFQAFAIQAFVLQFVSLAAIATISEKYKVVSSADGGQAWIFCKINAYVALQ